MPITFDSLVEAGQTLTSSLAWDRSFGHGFVIDVPLRDFTPGLRLAGPAFPAVVDHAILPVLQALREVPAHHILVIQDRRGGREAVLGDIIMTAARAAGVGGIVCFGAIRDVDQTPAIGLPIWAERACPIACPLGEPVDSPPESIALGGGTIRRGDWLFGDGDGLVCIEREHARLVIKAAQIKAKRERAFVARLHAGERLADAMNLEGFLTRNEKLIIDF